MNELTVRGLTSLALIGVCWAVWMSPALFLGVWTLISGWILVKEWPRLAPWYSGIVYPGIILVGIAYLFADPATRHIVWIGIISAVAFDTSAFMIGRLYGSHPIIPTISPKKSWEGCIGGYITVAILYMLAMLIYHDTMTWHLGMRTVAAATLVSIAAFAGDAIISWFKRKQNVKDSSHILPGHGGILDRCDSLLLTIPAVYSLYLMNIV